MMAFRMADPSEWRTQTKSRDIGPGCSRCGVWSFLTKSAQIWFRQNCWPRFPDLADFSKSALCMVYTVSQNKTPMQFFCDNFGKCAIILIILSLLHSTMNYRRRYYIIRHLTSNLLLHYLAKFECSATQLYTIVGYSKV